MWNNLDAPSLESALDFENHVQVLALMTQDFGEAALAFSQKRAPQWRGR
jgi:enoyl-CoA hydratase